MKRLILLFVIINISSAANTQNIKGTVFDIKTKEKIYSASVYFNGTSVGVLSDQNGDFKIDISKYSTMPITISAIGYYSATVRDFVPSKPLLVYLNPKIFELNEVNVNAKFHSLLRNENLTIFRNEFIGTTPNSLNCKITNEDDILFKLSSDKDTLKAFAKKPLIINNKALGYNITYFLDKFEYSKQSQTFFFNGSIIFKEDSTINDRKKPYFEKKRRNTYLGSRMHFFRSLWINDLNSNQFTVRNSANEILDYEKLVYSEDGRTKYIHSLSNLGIAYNTKQSTSFILLSDGKIFFESNGYYDPLLIKWEGEMARQRVADILPFDYILK